jgi:hypothetical protein
VRVAHFTSALTVLSTTELVATIPPRTAELHAATDRRLRLVKTPERFDTVIQAVNRTSHHVNSCAELIHPGKTSIASSG